MTQEASVQRVVGEAAESLKLGDNDSRFLNRIFASGLSLYEQRIQQLGFVGLGRVLDLGCGFGQWSLALARHNEEVISVDPSSQRIDFLNRVCQADGTKNISTICAGAESSEEWGGEFDAVFAYGVLFLTPWKKTLSSIFSSLVPAGQVYFSANEIGWYLFLWETQHNRAADYDPRRVVSRVFQDTYVYESTGVFENGGNVIIDQSTLLLEMRALGFQDITVGGEGTIAFDSAEPSGAEKSFFSGKYKGLDAVYEVHAVKSS